MNDLKPITALGSNAAQRDQLDGLEISECPDWALSSVATRQGQESEFTRAAERVLGFALPEVGQCASKSPLAAFWTGPEQWMIEAPHDTHEDLPGQMKSAFGDAASVTEQTDGWVRFDLQGPRCCDALERLCNVNTRTMPSAHVTRTLLEHLGCFLICRTHQTHFSIFGPRSSAGSLHHALLIAAKSVI